MKHHKTKQKGRKDYPRLTYKNLEQNGEGGDIGLAWNLSRQLPMNESRLGIAMGWGKEHN